MIHVGHISRHPEIFSSSQRLVLFAETPESEIDMQRLMMLNMDPPQHTRQRSFVNRGFTPRMIGRLAKHVREICDTLIDEVVSRGEADFVTDIAAPLPLQVICELVGAPPEDRDWIFELSNKLVGYDDPEFRRSPEEGMQAAGEIHTQSERPNESLGPAAPDLAAAIGDPDDDRFHAGRLRLLQGHIRNLEIGLAAGQAKLPQAPVRPPVNDALGRLGGELVRRLAQEHEIGMRNRHFRLCFVVPQNRPAY